MAGTAYYVRWIENSQMRTRVFLLFSLIVFGLNSSGKTIKVCPECKVANLHLAISLATDGDTVIVEHGDYYLAPLTIDKSITLIGKKMPRLISKDGEELITISKPNVSIAGFHFSGVKTNYLKECSALRIKRQKNFIIENNLFDTCFFAIYLERARNGTIRNNRIQNQSLEEAASGNGIHAWYCDSLLISGNDINGQRDGIYFEFVSNSVVTNNKSQGNLRYGLHFMFSNSNKYTDNSFINNGAGVAVMFSKKIEMRRNKFVKNVGASSYGLLLKEIYDAEIIGNQFIDNTIAIFVEGSTRINYFQNLFKGNGRALHFGGGSLDNNLERNSFEFNTSDLLIFASENNNNFSQNHWTRYSGYDLDHDGIGDVPHRPMSLFSYLNSRVPEAILLSRSFFVELLNFAEKINPEYTPALIMDNSPLMNSPLD